MNTIISKPQQNFFEKIATGLRTRELEKELDNAVQNIEASLAATDKNTNDQPLTAASISDTGKFASVFLSRCLVSSSTGDKQAAYLLTDSLLNAATEISKLLGQENADEFLNDILNYTEKGVSEIRLSEAISDFFNKFQKEVKSDVILGVRLVKLADTFNRGLDILIDKDKMLPEALDKGLTPGLAFAMNNFFSTDYTVAENKDSVTTKGFSCDFDRNRVSFGRVELTYSKPEQQEGGPVKLGWMPNGYFYIDTAANLTAGELIDFENGTLLKAADYLRTKIGNEKAAALLENLLYDANLMDALASTVAIVATENGIDEAIGYVSYLNGNMKNAINSVIPEGITFEGWVVSSQTQAKSSHQGSSDTFGGMAVTVDSPNGSSAKLILSSNIDKVSKTEIKDMGLGFYWRNDTGPGVTYSMDLNRLYARLR